MLRFTVLLASTTAILAVPRSSEPRVVQPIELAELTKDSDPVVVDADGCVDLYDIDHPAGESAQHAGWPIVSVAPERVRSHASFTALHISPDACVDKSKYEEPICTRKPSRGKRECSELADVCQGLRYSWKVRMKCPVTCGLCNSAKDEMVTMSAPTPAVAPTTPVARRSEPPTPEPIAAAEYPVRAPAQTAPAAAVTNAPKDSAPIAPWAIPADPAPAAPAATTADAAPAATEPTAETQQVKAMSVAAEAAECDELCHDALEYNGANMEWSQRCANYSICMGCTECKQLGTPGP